MNQRLFPLQPDTDRPFRHTHRAEALSPCRASAGAVYAYLREKAGEASLPGRHGTRFHPCGTRRRPRRSSHLRRFSALYRHYGTIFGVRARRTSRKNTAVAWKEQRSKPTPSSERSPAPRQRTTIRIRSAPYRRRFRCDTYRPGHSCAPAQVSRRYRTRR